MPNFKKYNKKNFDMSCLTWAFIYMLKAFYLAKK